MKNDGLLVSMQMEHRTADRCVIAIRAALHAIPWRMELLRSTWRSLGPTLAAAYVADCYVADHPQERRLLDRAELAAAIQLSMPPA